MYKINLPCFHFDSKALKPQKDEEKEGKAGSRLPFDGSEHHISG